jgi:hypothetical protein
MPSNNNIKISLMHTMKANQGVEIQFHILNLSINGHNNIMYKLDEKNLTEPQNL